MNDKEFTGHETHTCVAVVIGVMGIDALTADRRAS
jgi:hypothetical protein